MAKGIAALCIVVLSLCLASAVDAESDLVRKLKAKRPSGSLLQDGGAVPEDQLKEMLAQVMKSDQMQQMGKNPALVKSLMEMMHDKDKIAQLTGDADLAQSLYTLVDKDPQVLMQVMREAGFDVAMSPEEIKFASMEELHTEFQRLSKTDEDHLVHLKKNNHLRDALKMRLGAVVDAALKDTSHVNERLHAIAHQGKAKREVVVAQDGSLLESLKGDKLQGLEELSSVEEIKSALDEIAQDMNKKIGSLRTQDDIELEALEDNVQIRSKLKEKLQEQIKEQQKEISFASDVEANLFDKV